MRALIGRETCCKHRCDVKIFCCAWANLASTNLKNVLRWKLDKFEKFTLFTHFVSGLHNCLELVSQPLSCLYQAIYANTESVRFLLLNYNPVNVLLYWYTSYCYHLTSRVELVISLVFTSMRILSLTFTEIINNYPNMTKWDIHIYDRVHPDWDTPFQTPFPDHSHSTWLMERFFYVNFDCEDRVKNKQINRWYCIEEVRYRNSFSAIIKDSSLQETKLKHFKNVFIFGNAMLVFQQAPFSQFTYLKDKTQL